MDDSVTDSYLLGDSGNEYFAIRRDRGSIGGGVCAFIRKSLCPVQVKIPVSGAFNAVPEMIAFDYGPLASRRRCVLAYRPPSGPSAAQSEYLSAFLAPLQQLLSTKIPFALFVDANFPQINWSRLSASSGLAQRFLDFCTDSGLAQLVKSPTRGDNTLDLVLSSHPDSFLECTVSPNRFFSDHDEVCISARPFKSRKAPIEATPAPFRNFRMANYSAISSFIASTDWAFIDDIATDCTELCSFIMEVLEDAFSRFIPWSTGRRPGRSLPPRLANLRKRRFKALRSRSKSAAHRSRFKKIDKKYRTGITRFYKAAERSVLRGSRYGLFRYFKSVRSNIQQSLPMIVSQGGQCVTDGDKANAFADYFASVYSAGSPAPPQANQPPSRHTLISANLGRANVLHALQRLKPKLSRGLDGIPPLALKKTADAISEPLSLLYSRSLASADVPAQFLPCLSSPIFKGKGERSLPGNYRPINVASSICKPMESIINSELLAFLERHEMLPSSQFGFRHRRSTTSQMLSFTDYLSSNRAKKSSTSVVWLDFRAAFDMPPHSLIIHKLSRIGLEDPLLNWISEFITSRSSSVKVGKALSEPFRISSGLCQGSPLSATIFLIYISDLLIALEGLTNVRCFAYADDIKLASSNNAALQAALDLVEDWCSNWHMSLSLHKCIVGHFGPGPPFQLSIGNIPLPQADPSANKDLGLWVDPALNFSAHVNEISKKARSVSAIILRSFSSRSTETLSEAFQVFVRPLLEGSSPVWNSILKRDSAKLESVQKLFSLRVMRRCGFPRLSYEKRLDILGLERLSSRRRRLDICFAHSALSGVHYCPSVKPHVESRSYRLRDSHRLASDPRPNAQRSRAFSNRTAVLYNALPLHIRQLKPRAFRSNISDLRI